MKSLRWKLASIASFQALVAVIFWSRSFHHFASAGSIPGAPANPQNCPHTRSIPCSLAVGMSFNSLFVRRFSVRTASGFHLAALR